jgi:hypothetical protein
MCGECNWKLESQKMVKGHFLLKGGIQVDAHVSESQYIDLIDAMESQSDEIVIIAEMEISGKTLRKIWRDS